MLTVFFCADSPKPHPKRTAFQERARRMDELELWPSDLEQALYVMEDKHKQKEQLPFAEYTHN